MNKNRLNQAEDLIKKAGSMNNSSEIIKEPQEGIINVKLFEKALKDLIEAEDFIYSSLPSHQLNLEESKLFTRKNAGCPGKYTRNTGRFRSYGKRKD